MRALLVAAAAALALAACAPHYTARPLDETDTCLQVEDTRWSTVPKGLYCRVEVRR